LLAQTGNARLGSPSFGSWATYGLGTENQNLPGFIVLLSGGKTPDGGKQLWGSGFLPSVYQGCNAARRRAGAVSGQPTEREPAAAASAIGCHRRHQPADPCRIGNPETVTRIAQYEMAFRMQLHATEAMDIHREPEGGAGSLRRQAGRGLRQQLSGRAALGRARCAFHSVVCWGWDSHGTGKDDSLEIGFANSCRKIDQPSPRCWMILRPRDAGGYAGSVGREFGRIPMRENRGGTTMSTWAATITFSVHDLDGGRRCEAGMSYGETDDLGYEVVKNPVEIRDLHATMLYLLGFDHRKLNFSFQGWSKSSPASNPRESSLKCWLEFTTMTLRPCND